MSQPYSAFMQVRIARGNLVRWLDEPVPDPGRWADWRSIGGAWYLPGGVGDLADATVADMGENLAKARAWLARYGSNRAALRGFTSTRDAAAFRRFTYDPATTDFVAGTLFYDESLISFVAFLTMVRGIADHLAPGDRGLAVIHDYAFPEDDDVSAALALGPRGTSRLLVGEEREGAVTAFQPIADAMLADHEQPPPPEDQLGNLR